MIHKSREHLENDNNSVNKFILYSYPLFNWRFSCDLRVATCTNTCLIYIYVFSTLILWLSISKLNMPVQGEIVTLLRRWLLLGFIRSLNRSGTSLHHSSEPDYIVHLQNNIMTSDGIKNLNAFLSAQDLDEALHTAGSVPIQDEQVTQKIRFSIQLHIF